MRVLQSTQGQVWIDEEYWGSTARVAPQDASQLRSVEFACDPRQQNGPEYQRFPL